METQQIAPHIDDIARVLGKNGKKTTKKEIEQALVNDIEKFGKDMSIPELKRMIVKRMGGDPDELNYGMTKPLAELKPGESKVDILCRVLTINTRELDQEGQKKKIVYGIIEDQYTTKPFTAWEADMMADVAKGDVILIKSAFTKERQGEAQVNLGTKSKVTKMPKDALPARDKSNVNGSGAPRQNERDVKIDEMLKMKEHTFGLGVTARVLTVIKREITANDQKKTIFSGTIADETGRIGYTSWSDLGLKQDEVLKISGGYVKLWNDTPSYNFDDRCKVERLEDDKLPKMELPPSGMDCKIKDLKEGLASVNIVGRVLSVQKKDVTVNEEPRVVFSGVIADETGRVNFSSWSDFSLADGEVIKITNASVKLWRGMPQISFDGRSSVERLKDSTLPSADKLNTARVVTIEELMDVGGAAGVAIQGVIIDVKSGSGLILRCPECNRVLQNESCMVHGKQKGNPDLRAKTVLDDGTGALSTILNREITERLIGMNLEACQNLAKDRMNMGAVRDKIIEMLIAQPIEVSGNVTSDEYGLMMVAQDAKIIKPDVKALAREMLAKMGVN